MKPFIILASRSPRRRELLAKAGYRFEVSPPSESAEDGVRPRESTSQYVERLARQKAFDVAQRIASGYVLGCDTVAQCNGKILGKPTDEADARRMLTTLRGRQHQVLSGICLFHMPGESCIARVAVTTLAMDWLSDEQIAAYLASKQWMGKAGAFGYQDQIGWVHILEGSESNVVGLPLELLAEMLPLC